MSPSGQLTERNQFLPTAFDILKQIHPSQASHETVPTADILLATLWMPKKDDPVRSSLNSSDHRD